MALTIKKTSGNFAPAPVGLHHAVCIRIIDLGTQKSSYGGKTKLQRKVMFGWEISNPELRQENGMPFAVFKRYTASLGDKATLAADINGWLGKAPEDDELDLTQFLGKACAVNIIHKPGKKDPNKVYAEPQSVSPPMAGISIPEPITKPAAFDLDNPDWALFHEFSEYTQNLIRRSPEYAALDLPDGLPEPLTEEPPKVEMAVDDKLFATIISNIDNGITTAEQVLGMGYDFSEAQRLEIENRL